MPACTANESTCRNMYQQHSALLLTRCCPAKHILFGSSLQGGSSNHIHGLPYCHAGHSLGGALAQLASHDIRKAAEENGINLKLLCYTFGSPRVGNHAFAREYNKVRTHSRCASQSDMCCSWKQLFKPISSLSTLCWRYQSSALLESSIRTSEWFWAASKEVAAK